MIIYIVTEEPYHDNGTIIGVFDDANAAEIFVLEVARRGDYSDGFQICSWDVKRGKQVAMQTWYSANTDYSDVADDTGITRNGCKLWKKRQPQAISLT